MRILVINDDGIDAFGLPPLVRAAKELGEVTVVAPLKQCSAMSMRLTIHQEMDVREKKPFAVDGVKAFSVDGTPADCVKAAMWFCMPEKPDLVLSGINWGYNTGYDIAYSGTCGGAFQARMYGIPAMAFSTRDGGDYAVTNAYLLPVIRQLLELPLAAGDIWNVNFPECPVEELKGILFDRKIATEQMYRDNYITRTYPDGRTTIEEHGIILDPKDTEPGTDVHAVLNNYISVGTAHCCVL